MWQRRVGCLRARYGDHSAERCRGRQGSLGLLSPVAAPPDLPVRPADGWKRPVGGQHLQYGRHPLRASGTGNGFAHAVHDRLARQGLSGADPCPGRLVQHVSPGVPDSACRHRSSPRVCRVASAAIRVEACSSTTGSTGRRREGTRGCLCCHRQYSAPTTAAPSAAAAASRSGRSSSPPCGPRRS